MIDPSVTSLNEKCRVGTDSKRRKDKNRRDEQNEVQVTKQSNCQDKTQDKPYCPKALVL